MVIRMVIRMVIHMVIRMVARKHSHHSHAGGNHNIRAIFLHIVADALGSLGVIISSILVKYFEFYIADPICSLIISVLIILSVIPLLRFNGCIAAEDSCGIFAQ